MPILGGPPKGLAVSGIGVTDRNQHLYTQPVTSVRCM